MTVNTAYGSTDDAFLACYSTSYSNAVGGSGTFAYGSVSNTYEFYGQRLSAGFYYAWQSFQSWTTSVATGDRAVTAWIEAYTSTSYGTSTSRDMEFRAYTWTGGGLTSADWRTPSQLSSATLLGKVSSVQAASAGSLVRGGSYNLKNNLGGAVQAVVCSSRNRASSTPTGDERSSYISADYTTTTYDPKVVYLTAPDSALWGCLGASVQLSDGTHVYVAWVDERTSPYVELRHWDGSSTTVIDDLTPDEYPLRVVQNATAMQEVSLCRDDDDNLYLVAALTDTLYTRAYSKGAGYTWTRQNYQYQSMPTYDTATAYINQTACCWLSGGGSSGTVVVVCAHSAGTGVANQGTYALLDAATMLAGAAKGAPLSASGDLWVDLLSPPSTTAYVGYPNVTGSGMDICAAPGSTDAFVVASFNRRGRVSHCIAAINGTGTGIASSYTYNDGVSVTLDAEGKVRVLGTGATSYAVVYGGNVRTFSCPSTTVTLTGYVQLHDESISSFPTSAALQSTLAWDAIYDEPANRVWHYYFDASDPDRLMRTAVDLDTKLAVRDETEVDATVGSGGDLVAIRAPRGEINPDTVRIAAAEVASDGADDEDHTTVYVDDEINVPPDAPTLTARTNFDATSDAAFAWTFSDANAADTQSAFQLDINTAAGSDVYDTGKVASATAAYVGVGAASSADNTSLTPALPSGVAEGDLLLLLASVRNSGTGTPDTPAGWAVLLDLSCAVLFGRIATDSETDPTVTFTGGVSGATTLAQVAAFRNVPTGVVLDATQLNGSAQDVTYPALAVADDNCLVVAVAWKQDNWTSVTGLPGTEISDSATSETGDDAAMGWSYTAQTTAATVSSGTVTVTGGAAAISRAGLVALGPAGHTPTAETMTLLGGLIPNDADYQWRVRTWDASDEVGAWSSYSTFSTSSSGVVTIIDPASDWPEIDTTDYTIEWSVSGATQDDYRVVVTRIDTSETLVSTGWVTSSATTYEITGMVSQAAYLIEVTVRDGGVESNTAARSIAPDYSTPMEPEITATAYDSDGYILVSIDNPVPSGDRPEAAYNEVYRRVSGSGDAYELIGQAQEDGAYDDYEAASGVAYQYRVRAVVEGETAYADSDPATATLVLTGVWVHDRQDPDGTAVGLPYGSASRSVSVEVDAGATSYAGRTYPVVDFGEHQSDQFTVKIEVTDGAAATAEEQAGDLTDLVEGRRLLVVRDNRGRVFVGLVQAYAEADVDYGYSVSLTVERAAAD